MKKSLKISGTLPRVFSVSKEVEYFKIRNNGNIVQLKRSKLGGIIDMERDMTFIEQISYSLTPYGFTSM